MKKGCKMEKTIGEFAEFYGMNANVQAKMRHEITMKKLSKQEHRGVMMSVYSPAQEKAMLSHKKLFMVEYKGKLVLAKLIKELKSL